MVPHVSRCLGSEQIATRRFEEFQSRAVLDGGRVRDVDDDFGVRKRIVEALARDRVDARAGRCWNHFVALLMQLARDLGSDETGTADDDNLHDSPSIWRPSMALFLNAAGECAVLGRKSLQPA